MSTASLVAKGAKLSNRYNSKHMTGFVLDLPDGVDEEDAIAKLNAHDEVVKVVPDTWVGIAGAAGGSSHAAEVPHIVAAARQQCVRWIRDKLIGGVVLQSLRPAGYCQNSVAPQSSI